MRCSLRILTFRGAGVDAGACGRAFSSSGTGCAVAVPYDGAVVCDTYTSIKKRLDIKVTADRKATAAPPSAAGAA